MKSSVLASLATLSLAALMMAGPAFAQSHSDHGHVQTQATSAAANELTDGEVRRIDAVAGKITIRHGEIKSLDMPPMTMVFTAAELGLLNNLKVGDKIRFVVEQQQGRMVVTRIVPAS